MEELFAGSGAACGNGNPLRNAANRLAGDTPGHEYQRRQGEVLFHDPFAEQRDLVDAHGQVDSFFGRGDWAELDPTFDGLPLAEAQHIPGEFERRLGAPVLPLQEKDAHLKDLFKGFWDASKQGQTLWGSSNGPQLGASLSGLEKQKIRSRADVTLRHLNPEPRQAAAQLGALFSELHITQAPPQQRQVAIEHWADEFTQDRWAAKQLPQRGRGNDWATEFSGDRWVDDFRRFEQDRAQRGWVDEYAHFDQDRWKSYNEAWNQGVGETWVNDFVSNPVTPLETRIQYQQFLASLTEEEAAKELRALAARFVEHPDAKFQNSKFRNMMAGIGSGDLKVQDNTLVTATPTPAEQFAQEQDGLAQWLSEYETFDEPDMHRSAAFEGWERDFGHLFPSHLSSFGLNRQYEFQKDNPFLRDTQAEEKGRALFSRGELGDAILAFEAVAQASPESATAWRLLGQAHAENDRDDRAISALTRACRLDPGDPEALLALAVSCINDSYRDQALQVLRSWLENNPRYKDHVQRWTQGMSNEGDMHEQLTYLFIEAAKLSPMDPDENVQIALGLLFNISGEFDKAVDCFRTALKKREDDYLLWNKLGATLANSNHSKEALQPYYQSLSLKPTYTRARANLGISYLNLEMYEEAATTFLQCLALQPSARHLWMSLHTVFSRMNRDDLLEKSLSYDIELFRSDFQF
eukprot:TRINITY_DN2913_c0_g1_i1.p1 TRINITY_DN2913_c0_g1~~TRINITY_DN2913_c0_g1_i1.p1  ORF type:complete len:693 (+),score=61.67 TRINITY_DN2913_c0_g1_i1:3-2081(+)